MIRDFELIWRNCRQYNGGNELFERKCVMLERNFRQQLEVIQKDAAEKGLDLAQPINVTQQMVDNFKQIVQKQQIKRMGIDLLPNSAQGAMVADLMKSEKLVLSSVMPALVKQQSRKRSEHVPEVLPSVVVADSASVYQYHPFRIDVPYSLLEGQNSEIIQRFRLTAKPRQHQPPPQQQQPQH